MFDLTNCIVIRQFVCVSGFLDAMYQLRKMNT